MNGGLGPSEAVAERAQPLSRAPMGILVLDKPTGLPSNRVLGQVKRLVGGTRMGFLGTLDPLASGVLPVFVGKATRLIPLFEGLPKTYRATLKLGERTATFDADGEVIERRPWNGFTAERVRAAILAKMGTHRQAVPPYSAVKVGGVPAYVLARQGKAVPQRARDVTLWDIEVEAVELPSATFRVTCSAGTYVRSLVEELGLSLGPGAHVTALRRLACGSLFTLADSVTLDGFDAARQSGRLDGLRNPAEFLPDHAPLVVTPETEILIRDGRTVPLDSPATGQYPRAAPAEAAGSPVDATAGWYAGQGIKALRPDGSLIAVGVAVDREPEAPLRRLSFRPRRVLI